MSEFAFTPPATPSLAVFGSSARFPIRRVFCVGRNYATHAREMGSDPNREPPFFFTKPADAVVDSGRLVHLDVTELCPRLDADARTARVAARLIDDLMSLSRIELAEHQPPVGEVPPRTKTLFTPSMSRIRAASAWVVRSVSSSVAPGGSSTLIGMRLTSSGGMKLPGMRSMKNSDTASTPIAATRVR